MSRSIVVALLCTGFVGTSCVGTIASGDECTPPAKVRRLTRAELDATYSYSTGAEVHIAQGLAAEDMQLGYFGHDSLQVSTLFADQLDSATTEFSKERAMAVECGLGESERDCAKRVLKDLAGMTWRRPVTQTETDELMALYDVGRDGETFRVGVALAMQGIFEATGALYRTELGDETATMGSVELTQWEIASALSFLATGLPPDPQLRASAALEELNKPDVRVAQLRRLLETPAATKRMREFAEQWFGLTNMGQVQKNNAYFPKFNVGLRDDIAESARAFLDVSLSTTKGSVPDLLAADYTYANDRVAEFLGSSERPGMSMARISTASLPRRGLLTHPAVLSVYAHNDDGSPVLRGRLVRSRLLCEEIPPPPPTVVAAVQPVTPDSTTRERATAHAAAACRGCHDMMDPIGFGLEGYDGFGEFRTMEAGKPIDDSGEVKGSDVEGPFKGGPELANKLAASPQVGECAVLQLTRFSIGRKEAEADQCMVSLSLDRYLAAKGSLYAALEGMVESEAFVKRRHP
ncbi:MAG: DUF1592 domain-containing protein [Myxococcaceae bacterium]|nr:DUF1592 domain-containing protein [Myxococcaceae bacterium]